MDRGELLRKEWIGGELLRKEWIGGRLLRKEWIGAVSDEGLGG